MNAAPAMKKAAPVKERPILFSAPMVRALLEKRKTQTRRALAFPDWVEDQDAAAALLSSGSHVGLFEDGRVVKRLGFRHGVPGDRLWVRETWYCDHCFVGDYAMTKASGFCRPLSNRPEGDRAACEAEWKDELYYRADVPSGRFEDAAYWGEPGSAWRPSIFMPRWASRITLEITEVRVERLQDISEEDARAEGAAFHDGRGIGNSGWRHDLHAVHETARDSFFTLWAGINGLDSLQANPWVWVLSFRSSEGAESSKRSE